MYRTCLIILFAFLPSLASASDRIGFVDLRKALNEVTDGQDAREKLKKKKTDYQTKLNSAQETLKKEKEVFDRRATILRGPAKRKAELDLQKKFVDLQQMYTKLTRELAKDEAEETRRIFRKMEGIIRDIARENKLMLMLEKTESSILYALPAMDYTNDLIRRYNRIFGKGGSGTAEAAPSKKGKKRRAAKKKEE